MVDMPFLLRRNLSCFAPGGKTHTHTEGHIHKHTHIHRDGHAHTYTVLDEALDSIHSNTQGFLKIHSLARMPNSSISIANKELNLDLWTQDYKTKNYPKLINVLAYNNKSFLVCFICLICI